MLYKPIYHNLQIIMVSVHVSLNLKREVKIFLQETMAASENRFAPELNEKEVIELLENAGSIKIKPQNNYGMKIFQGKNMKTSMILKI